MGTDHGIHWRSVASIFVLCIAFVKVRLVGLYFMEIRRAPIVLRALFGGYCAFFLALVVGMYVVA
ncbi:cytochrome C oxidase subunit IV family protein [Mycobacterium arosiense]|uniref:cytochrome C oxidase subunit IV family protein n=1 Tax=Mycobacterium arosiense TaxID=425468 RepID=UPI001FEB21ED|nr:cytochrome C oxidase subunit IV family protein [Mycobacterium arosiense]